MAHSFRAGRSSDVGFWHDRLGGAVGFANAGVDALVRIDDEHILALIETVDGAHLDAVHIFAPDAGIGDDIGHGLSAPSGGGNRAAMHSNRSPLRSEEHTSELQSLMRISYAVFCLKKKNTRNIEQYNHANTTAQESE